MIDDITSKTSILLESESILNDYKNIVISKEGLVQDAILDIEIKQEAIKIANTDIAVAVNNLKISNRKLNELIAIYDKAYIVVNGNDSQEAADNKQESYDILTAAETVLLTSDTKVTNANAKVTSTGTRKSDDEILYNNATGDVNSSQIIYDDKLSIMEQKRTDALTSESVNVEDYIFTDEQLSEESQKEITLNNVSTTVGNETVTSLSQLYIEYNIITVFGEIMKIRTKLLL